LQTGGSSFAINEDLVSHNFSKIRVPSLALERV
jgi:hypothetical protein